MRPISVSFAYFGSYMEKQEIDFTLLKAAEEKITSEISKYSDHSSFYLSLDGEHLRLSVEVIVDIAAPLNGDTGCSIDHEHLFFGEQITP